jgi:hypothetical protein
LAEILQQLTQLVAQLTSLVGSSAPGGPSQTPEQTPKQDTPPKGAAPGDTLMSAPPAGAATSTGTVTTTYKPSSPVPCRGRWG